MKQFFGYLMIILLFGGSICGVVFGIKLIQANNQIDNLYTEEEVEQKYQQYIDQISEKNVVIDELNGQLTILITENEQHETTISNLQSSISEKDIQIETLTSEKTTLAGQIESLNSQISELNSQIETLSEDKENNLAQIEELQSEKSALETQVSTLTASVNEKEQTIQTLTADKIELEEEVSTLTSAISQNETTISSLNSQILTLQNEITRLEGLLEGYEDIKNGTFELDFYVDEILFTTKVVRANDKLSTFNSPTKDFYKFKGWSVNKTDVVDIFNMAITENMTLYAVFELDIAEEEIINTIEANFEQSDVEINYFSPEEKVLFVSNANFVYYFDFSLEDFSTCEELLPYLTSENVKIEATSFVVLTKRSASKYETYESSYNSFYTNYCENNSIESFVLYVKTGIFTQKSDGIYTYTADLVFVRSDGTIEVRKSDEVYWNGSQDTSYAVATLVAVLNNYGFVAEDFYEVNLNVEQSQIFNSNVL